MNEYILAIDCGTQSIRAIIFDSKGKMIHKVKETFEPYFSKKPGYAEQHVTIYWDSLCRVTNQVKKENRDPRTIGGLTREEIKNLQVT